MSDFIPFHRELTRGDKRALSRATRFIYLELALYARQTGGVMRLPFGVDIVDAVHDELGGNRREIADALKALQKPLRPGEPPMVRIDEQDGGARDLVIVSWETWKLRDTGPERSRRYRERRRDEASRMSDTSPSRDAERDVTPTNDVTKRDSVTPRNGTEERRGEESKKEEVRVTRDPPPTSSSGLTPGARHDAAETYADEARELSPSGVWGFTTNGERNIVANAVATYAPKDATAEQRREWIGVALVEWQRVDPAASVGFAPLKFGDWLRNGRKARESKFAQSGPAPIPPPREHSRADRERQDRERAQATPPPKEILDFVSGVTAKPKASGE